MIFGYSIFITLFIFTLVFWQTTFSDSMSISSNLPIQDVNDGASNPSNIAPCARASSSGGGTRNFGPEKMNDAIEKEDCSYHWVRTRNKVGHYKVAWIRLDWDEEVTVTRMTIQTTECDGSCGEDEDDPHYIDQGRNLGKGMVQYLDRDRSIWITDNEFIDEAGDIEYSFTKPITTKAIRIKRISPSKRCKGQQSNPVIFEWKVYGTPACK